MLTKKQINHPLRTIELSYNEMKPFQPFEKEMLERYTQLHNFVKELFEEYSSVEQKYDRHNQHIDKAIFHFKQLKAHMNHLEKNAKKILNLMLPDKTAADMMVAEAGEFGQLVRNFNTEMQKLADESERMYTFFMPLDTKDERFTEIFEEYKDFKQTYFNSDADYSLDMERYDSDEQQFMNSLENMTQVQEKFVSTCNTTIERYNLLVQEVEELYEQWEQYNDMIDMMKLIVITPNDISRVCLN